MTNPVAPGGQSTPAAQPEAKPSSGGGGGSTAGQINDMMQASGADKTQAEAAEQGGNIQAQTGKMLETQQKNANSQGPNSGDQNNSPADATAGAQTDLLSQG